MKRENKMDDLERYGDYNEIEDPPSKSKVLLAIKITAAVVILAVAALLGYRIFLYNYYPENLKSIYSDEKLAAYYEQRGDEATAKTQALRIPYDDPQVGSLFCDNLFVIEDLGDGLGRVQITLRYNFSAIEYIEQKYQITGLHPEGKGIFDFALYRNDLSASDKDQFKESDKVGKLIAAEYETFAMYGYYKLVFDDVRLTGENAPSWLSLAVSVKDSGSDKPFGRIAIYENNEKIGFNEIKITKEDIDRSNGK